MIQTSTPTPTPVPAPPKPPSPRGLFDAKQLRELDAAEAVATAARRPDHAPALLLRDITPVKVTFLEAKVAETRALLATSKTQKGGAKAKTADARKQRDEVIGIVQQIQSAARQKFGAGADTINATYYGSTNLRENRATLTQVVQALLPIIKGEPLPGITDSTADALDNAFTAYEAALDAQGEGQGASVTDYQKAVDLLKVVVAKRQEIQFAANGLYPARLKINRENRKDFKIPPGQNYTG